MDTQLLGGFVFQAQEGGHHLLILAKIRGVKMGTDGIADIVINEHLESRPSPDIDRINIGADELGDDRGHVMIIHSLDFGKIHFHIGPGKNGPLGLVVIAGCEKRTIVQKRRSFLGDRVDLFLGSERSQDLSDVFQQRFLIGYLDKIRHFP
jgi:hypothetical protein